MVGVRWLVVSTPALVGVVSFVLSPNDDLRSSGLLAGVALSIVFAGVLLAVRRPWRARSGAAAWAARVGVVVVVVVGLVGLVEGVPSLLRERFGLLVSADDRGLYAVASLDGGFVAVGHPETGAAWTSPDGVTWTPVPLPASVDGLELRALAHLAGTLWVVAQDETSAGVLTEVPGLDQDWVAGGRFVHTDHDQEPNAAAALDGQLVTFGSTFSNDVAFFRGDPHTTLVLTGPEPVGDRGHEAEDLGCSDDGCVAVGSHWEPAAAFWHTTDGRDWDRAQLDRDAVSATGVIATADGWLAVGHALDGSAVTWQSSDGRSWEQYPALAVNEAEFDGVTVNGDVVTAYGRNTASDQVAMWTLAGDSWTQTEFTSPAGSRIRDVASHDGTIAAVGVRGDTLQAATWVSTAGSPFQLFSLETQGP